MAIGRLIERVLSTRGNVVEYVQTPEEALAAVRLRMPDLVITDWVSLGMSGTHFVQKLATFFSGPVVVCSGIVPDLMSLPEPIRSRCRVLLKPFPIERLVYMVESSLSH